jgi:hypothetical protein
VFSGLPPVEDGVNASAFVRISSPEQEQSPAPDSNGDQLNPLTRCCSLLRPDPRLRQCRPVTLQPRNLNGRGSLEPGFRAIWVAELEDAPKPCCTGSWEQGCSYSQRQISGARGRTESRRQVKGCQRCTVAGQPLEKHSFSSGTGASPTG